MYPYAMKPRIQSNVLFARCGINEWISNEWKSPVSLSVHETTRGWYRTRVWTYYEKFSVRNSIAPHPSYPLLSRTIVYVHRRIGIFLLAEFFFYER